MHRSRHTAASIHAAVLLAIILLTPATFATLAATAHAGTPNWSAGGKWLWMNPRPQGAKLNAVDFPSPARGWAVGDGGVAMKTTNGGATWSRAKLPVPPGGPYRLTDVCFVSTARGWLCDANGGVYRTIDGGANWTVQGSGSTSCFGIEFVDAANGWLACMGSGTSILHTTDGGENWATQGVPVAEILRAVAAVSPLEAWAVGDGGKAVHTTDGGANWAEQSTTAPKTLECVTFLDAQHGWASGGWDTVLHTTDGGANWLRTGTGHPFYRVTGVAFTDALNGFATLTFNDGWTDDGHILRSTDGGANWEHVVQSNENSFCGVATAGGSGAAVGTGGAIWRAADIGGSWTWMSATSGTGSRLNDIDMADARYGWACGYMSSVWRTADGGSSWTMQLGGGGGRYDALWAVSPTEAFACGIPGIFHTTDSGANWTAQTTPLTKEVTAIAFLGAGAMHGWAVTWGGQIAHTSDGGANWGAQVSGTSSNLWDVWVLDPQTAVAVGDAGLILRTSDGGASWGPRASPIADSLQAVTFASATEGWAVGGWSGKIAHTTDAGLTWGEVMVGADVPGASSVSFVTPLVGWIGCDHGIVSATTDGGTNWTKEQLVCDETVAGIDAVSPQAVFAAGTNGMIVARDGAQPTTSAPSRATVRRGRTAKLKYKVSDPLPNGCAATVTIKVRNARGKVVKTLRCGVKPIGRTFTASFRCRLQKGTYTFTVYATDTAGNTQRRAGKNRLVVT